MFAITCLMAFWVERERVFKYQLFSNTVGSVEREGQWWPQSYRSTLGRLKLCRTFNPKFVFLLDEMQRSWYYWENFWVSKINNYITNGSVLYSRPSAAHQRSHVIDLVSRDSNNSTQIKELHTLLCHDNNSLSSWVAPSLFSLSIQHKWWCDSCISPTSTFFFFFCHFSQATFTVGSRKCPDA